MFYCKNWTSKTGIDINKLLILNVGIMLNVGIIVLVTYAIFLKILLNKIELFDP